MEAVVEEKEVKDGGPFLAGLLPALQRLDRLLEWAVGAAQVAYECGPQDAAFRGLYISAEEFARLLRQPPGAPLPGPHTELDPAGGTDAGRSSSLERLREVFDLSAFDLDLILVALAPELDLRYERLYAYLQDDVTRRRPSVDLALNLLCPSAEAKLTRRAHFVPNAPLVRHGILHLIPDPHQVQPPLLAHYLKLDEQIVRTLLGQPGLDPRIAHFCQLIEPGAQWEELSLAEDVKRVVPQLVQQAGESGEPLRLYFRGAQSMGKRRAAEALAGGLHASLLSADLAQALENKLEFESALKLLFREARLHESLLYLTGCSALRREDRATPRHLLVGALRGRQGITILAGAEPWWADGWDSLPVTVVPFGVPDFADRRACWIEHLQSENFPLDPEVLDTLASRFHLTPGQIAEAARSAGGLARWRAKRNSTSLALPESVQPEPEELFAAARAQCGQDLAKLARKMEPKFAWEDIVLPSDQLAQLWEICAQARFRHLVYGAWGFDRKLSLGKGLNVLFAGPPGTGKTMAAEVIARELHLDLFRIDLSQIVSKYIGETEKNLERIFTAAEDSNAILFFDEADALFGKRSEVRDSHDRYANIEIAYLLQKMEEYEGISVLATNMRHHLDDAFVRRLQVIIEFPFPDENHRRRIWEVAFPAETPRAADVDFGWLAREVPLAGGNIRNMALAAAFYAASDGGIVHMKHLWHAARREHQKIGRSWHAPEAHSLSASGGR